MCVCVCVCVWTYVCMYVCIGYVSRHVRIHTCACVYMYPYASICTDVNNCVHDK